MRVNREEFLQVLDSVAYGLSVKEIQEQSKCFVFQNGMVMTYNDEVACRSPSGLEDSVKGAVRSGQLLDLLRQLPDDDLEIEITEEHLVVKGRKRQSGVRMEMEVLLNIDNVEDPTDWRELHDEFSDAISIVHECASKDKTNIRTHVHLHPKWIEASDNFQICRYRLKTGVESAVLLKSESIKNIVSLGMTEFSETETWIHFRNTNGLVYSCRRFADTGEYPNWSPFLKIEGGIPTTLPKGLKEAAERAKIFSSENADDNDVMVELRPGKLRIVGTGVSGWYKEIKSLKYNGSSLSFLISPELLATISDKHNDCEVTADRLKVDGGKWTYVTILHSLEDKE